MESFKTQGSLLFLAAIISLPSLLGVWVLVEVVLLLAGLGNLGVFIFYLFLVIIIYFILNAILGILGDEYS